MTELNLMASMNFPPQSFHTGDITVILVLVLLEALLSADNALVLALIVRHLPKQDQKRALRYGMGMAFFFRAIAIFLASKILALWWLQALGAVYLVYLPIKHFLHKTAHDETKVKQAKTFLGTVAVLALTDIAFALDSVLAAVAMIKAPDKLWIVLTGALLGMILLQSASKIFIVLLEKYPDLEHVAYVLVGWVGIKLAFMTSHTYSEFVTKNGGTPVIHGVEMPQWVFWSVLVAICVGGTLFSIRKGHAERSQKETEELLDEFEPELEPEREN